MDNIQLNKFFRLWHLIVILLLISLISIGGFTRLTNSGLSITNWELFSGILPPLNEQSWDSYFSLYKTIPQYNELNVGMTIHEFKYIFWWEYIHRLLARFLGLVYLLPFIFFVLRKIIYKNNFYYYLSILLLFIFQGFLGWFMVKSGLSVNVDVSHFRLAAHLGVAVIILLLIFWAFLNSGNQQLNLKLFTSSYLLLIFLLLVYIQIIFGAFTSGLDAGLIYQTWPYMNLNFLPDEVTLKSFFSKEIFTDRAHVQLLHRLNAYLIFVVFVIFYAYKLKKRETHLTGLTWILFFLIIQIFLGITTLISGLNIYLAALHQLTSIFLVMSIVSSIYRLKL
jgi:heme a synthase